MTRQHGSDLISLLKSLDIDEGIRIESTINKRMLFVNRKASGYFIVQEYGPMDDSSSNGNTRLLSNAQKVVKLIHRRFEGSYRLSSY
ncbi:MAG: hypothetical protein WB511_11375 [Nitrososphaeraceae archaeon]